jgi:hypothetical protein
MYGINRMINCNNLFNTGQAWFNKLCPSLSRWPTAQCHKNQVTLQKFTLPSANAAAASDNTLYRHYTASLLPDYRRRFFVTGSCVRF